MLAVPCNVLETFLLGQPPQLFKSSLADSSSWQGDSADFKEELPFHQLLFRLSYGPEHIVLDATDHEYIPVGKPLAFLETDAVISSDQRPQRLVRGKERGIGWRVDHV